MIWPGGAAPVGGESGNAVAAAGPLTKKTPSSWSSSGPPSEPAAAAVIPPAVRPAANKLMLMVQRFGFAVMMKSSQELRSRTSPKVALSAVTVGNGAAAPSEQLFHRMRRQFRAGSELPLLLRRWLKL